MRRTCLFCIIAALGGVPTYGALLLRGRRHHRRESLPYHDLRAGDRLARSLGIRAQLLPQGPRVHLQLDGRLPTPPGTLTLKILHPTRSGDDHDVTLSWDGSAYTGQFPQLAGAHYRIQLTPEFGDWRLTGELFPGKAVVLAPNA